MAVVAALVMCATAPGQTAGVSVFIGPMVEDLGIPRSQISTAYLVGTLFGAAVLPWIGRWVDRVGVRRAMLLIAVGFTAALVGMSAIQNVWTVTVGYMLIRSLGQGALGLTAVTFAARWYTRNRGTALGFVSAAGSAGISLAPLALEMLLVQAGWRSTWIVAGLAVAVIVVPLSLFVVRDYPPAPPVALDSDGAVVASGDFTRAQALREPWFWVLTSTVAVSGMFTTAAMFHQFDILQQRGLSSAAAAATFIPQAVAGIIATLLAGRLTEIVSPRVLMVAGMAMHTVAFAWGTVLTPGWSAVAYGLAIGAAGAFARTVEIVTVASTFGTTHMGAIRGIVSSVAVGSTALGPLIFASLEASTGNYTLPLLVAAAAPIPVAVFALIAKEPASSGRLT
ncbi:MAG: MFS transporter [Pseudoxanthomonas suwonensis]|nr:MAG: MFS transporter [Pseudoxanthomonas suwonensis]